MKTEDRALLAILFCGVAVFVTAVQVRQQKAVTDRQEWIRGHTVAAGTDRVVGTSPVYLGDPRAGFTLVEFADYQCPPCRAASRQIPQTLRQFKGKIRFTFRNLPLTQMHPRAMDAAIVAEAARQQNRFWPVHDDLMTGDLRPASIRTVVLREGLVISSFERACRSTARSRVIQDMRDAERLGLTGTPTFMLCRPDGRIVRLESIGDLDALMN